MKIVSSIKDLKNFLALEREKGKKVGLVPTMGALHAGHISLVKRCVAENDICVVSDFVYPEPDTRVFNLGPVAEVMEGPRRPGHFNGVAQVVSKLFYIVEPDNAYFGEKDFQQIAVIREMVRQLNLPVHIVDCPIQREADGLALSSRNTRLTPEQRQKAPVIARTLKESTTFVPAKSVQEVIDYVVDTINQVPEMEVEYFEIVDGNTMQPIQNWSDTTYPVGCITVYCGEVRLIDNIKY